MSILETIKSENIGDKTRDHQFLSRYGYHLGVVLQKMFSMVDAPLSILDDDFWFHKYEWTLEQETEFSKWFVEYLSGNREARLEFGMSWKNMTRIKKTVHDFIWNYGWKRSDEDYESQDRRQNL